mmetsp:Transcript_7586/g.20685  ORF Transcript_7586/g.20685 Transcript_7586/m.20685 type:complete len:240 (-) Transcript_7586:529-1248(-)
MGEVVDQFDLLHEIASDTAHQFAKIVLREVVRHPECDVLEARRELGVGLELGVQRSGLELLEEALIRGPEESNVRDVEQHHGQPLQSKPESPRLVALATVAIQNLLLHHATPEHFQPLPIKENLQLERRLGERKVRVYPPHLYFSEKLLGESLERLLQLLLTICRAVRSTRCLPLLFREHPHALHLMEHGIMCGIYGIPPIHVSGHQEGGESLPEGLGLVGTRVAAEHRFRIDVVRVVR